MGHWEGREGQDVRRGVRQQFGHLGKGLPELFHHSVQLAVDLCRRQLLVDGAYHGGHARLGTLGHSVSIFMVIRPAIFTDIQPPWERGELTIIRL